MRTVMQVPNLNGQLPDKLQGKGKSSNSQVAGATQDLEFLPSLHWNLFGAWPLELGAFRFGLVRLVKALGKPYKTKKRRRSSVVGVEKGAR